MSEPVQQHVHIYSLSNGMPQPLTASALQSSHFDFSFERAIAELELLPRMFIELDGSLVWCGEVETRRWQIDGMIYDRAGHVLRVELKGAAPRQAWEQLLSIFGWPKQPLVAQYVNQPRFVELEDFLVATVARR
ncbi:MAG: hypothetical protein KDA51_07290 [Planctomycetales bacterium]|nr:hypothetical protein [Planctomycetales bacterium]